MKCFMETVSKIAGFCLQKLQTKAAVVIISWFYIGFYFKFKRSSFGLQYVTFCVAISHLLQCKRWLILVSFAVYALFLFLFPHCMRLLFKSHNLCPYVVQKCQNERHRGIYILCGVCNKKPKGQVPIGFSGIFAAVE